MWSTPTSAAAREHLRGSVRNRARARRDHDLQTHTEFTVSPEDDVELRRVHITNGFCHNVNDGG